MKGTRFPECGGLFGGFGALCVCTALHELPLHGAGRGLETFDPLHAMSNVRRKTEWVAHCMAPVSDGFA